MTTSMATGMAGRTCEPACLGLYSNTATALDRDSALVDAAGKGSAKAVELSIAEGADVNAVNSSGDSALIVAVGGGHAEIVRVLMAAGADVHAVGAAGQDAVAIAPESALLVKGLAALTTAGSAKKTSLLCKGAACASNRRC